MCSSDLGIPAGGTLFNALAILLGGAIGLFAGRLVPERVQRSIFQYRSYVRNCGYIGFIQSVFKPLEFRVSSSPPRMYLPVLGPSA